METDNNTCNLTVEEALYNLKKAIEWAEKDKKFLSAVDVTAKKFIESRKRK